MATLFFNMKRKRAGEREKKIGRDEDELVAKARECSVFLNGSLDLVQWSERTTRQVQYAMSL